MMLEQAYYSEALLQVRQMARAGVFSELLHCAGGYVHDLHLVKFAPEREPWRLQYSVERNGNLYARIPSDPSPGCSTSIAAISSTTSSP